MTENNFQQRDIKTVEHYTPSWVVSFATVIMNEIDLDPATSAVANTVVQAKTIYTKDDDGLVHDWIGNVFCNPPGQPAKWFKKAVQEYKNGHLNKLFFVVYSIDRLPTILGICKQHDLKPIIYIPHKRINYLNSETLEPQTQPLHGSAFVYLTHEANLEYVSHSLLTSLEIL